MIIIPKEDVFTQEEFMLHVRLGVIRKKDGQAVFCKNINGTEETEPVMGAWSSMKYGSWNPNHNKYLGNYVKWSPYKSGEVYDEA